MKRAVIFGLLGLFLGAGTVVGLEKLMLYHSPDTVVVKNLELVPVTNHPDLHWMTVELYSPYSKGCELRQSFHDLHIKKKNADRSGKPQRDYYPLVTAMGSLNFPDSPSHFTVYLEIPAGIPSGRWYYIDRSVYWCIIWPGLVKLHTTQTAPWPIDLGDTGGG